jgi:hypothetical protein
MFKLIVFGYLVGGMPVDSKFYHEYTGFKTIQTCQEIATWSHNSFKHIHLLRTLCVEV